MGWGLKQGVIEFLNLDHKYGRYEGLKLITSCVQVRQSKYMLTLPPHLVLVPSTPSLTTVPVSYFLSCFDEVWLDLQISSTFFRNC